MTADRTSRETLRGVLLDQEETLRDLRAALAALDLISSVSEGIERDDMAGLRFVATGARTLADTLHRHWRDAVQHLDLRVGPGT